MKNSLAVLAIVLAVLSGGQFHVRGAATDNLRRTTAFLAASLTRFLDDNAAFTGTTTLDIVDTTGVRDPSRYVLGTALDRGKMRFDLDFATKANKAMNTGLPQMGVHRLMFVGYPDQPLRVVFPDMKTYVEVPLGAAPEVSAQAGLTASRLEKTLLGEETIGGVVTKKYRLHAAGSPERAFVWEAPALNNLPVRLRSESAGRSFTFTFSNIRVGRVDPRLFGIPSTFKNAGGFEEILKVGIARMSEQISKALVPR